MLSLNIETSQNITSVSLSSLDKILSSLEIDDGKPNHCELLAPLIEDLLRKNSSTINDLTQIRINIGPGNLSSLRVGIAAANIFASFAKVPVYGISSFLLYAFNYEYSNKNLITLFDLKNDNFAYAKFIKENSKISLIESDFNINLNRIELIDMNNSIIVGTGLKKYKKKYQNNSTPTSFLDEDFKITSESLANVDLDFQENLIFNKMPLVPFNSYSFGS